MSKDYFTLQIQGAAQRIEALREEAEEQRKSAAQVIEEGFKDGRTNKCIRFNRHKRGTCETEVAQGEFVRFARDSSWIYVRIFRRDGTLGEHRHMIDTADVLSFATFSGIKRNDSKVQEPK